MSQFKWHETAEKQWDEKSTLWNKNSQEMWDIGSRSSIVPFIQKHIQFGKRNEVNLLDLGCGDGYGSWKLYNAGYDVTGIDLSKEMVDLANKRCEEEQIDFIQSDLVTLPFENESFQAVTAINSFEWTEVPVNAILEMKRVLMNGGQACVGILGPTAKPRINAYDRLYGKDVFMNTMMPWEFQRLVKENGFEVLDGQGVFKKGIDEKVVQQYPIELQQSLTFMWLFMLKKKDTL